MLSVKSLAYGDQGYYLGLISLNYYTDTGEKEPPGCGLAAGRPSSGSSRAR